MRERLEQILKIICCVLAALLLVELVRAARHINPLAGAAMPPLPSLPADTNEVANAAPGKPPATATNATGTNALAGKASTNAPGTNAAAMIALGTNTFGTNAPGLATLGTNASVTNEMPTMALGTNLSATNVSAVAASLANGTVTNASGANASVTNAPETNAVALVKTQDTPSNAELVPAMASGGTNQSETNVSVAAGTNGAVAKLAMGTNISVGSATNIGGTNLVVGKKPHGKNPGPGFPPMLAMAGPGGKKPPSLPPDIQARVNRVTDSEIFGPVMHPMPMALLGIAGNVAFLRSPSGQTGLVKEGEELGDIKLLRIGINRVLIEQDGEKKELMIFSGFGGESLLPKPTESSDEITKKK